MEMKIMKMNYLFMLCCEYSIIIKIDEKKATFFIELYSIFIQNVKFKLNKQISKESAQPVLRFPTVFKPIIYTVFCSTVEEF